MNVIFMPNVVDYVENLVEILYIKGYFGFLDSSNKYVGELVDDIKLNLPTMQHRLAPTYFDRYGKKMKYAVFKKNKHTQ